MFAINVSSPFIVHWGMEQMKNSDNLRAPSSVAPQSKLFHQTSHIPL